MDVILYPGQFRIGLLNENSKNQTLANIRGPCISQAQKAYYKYDPLK